MLHYVYTIKDPLQDCVVYVGQTIDIEVRWRHHKSKHSSYDLSKLYNIRHEQGIELIFDVVFICDDSTIDQMEKDLICYYYPDGHLLNKVIFDEFGTRTNLFSSLPPHLR